MRSQFFKSRVEWATKGVVCVNFINHNEFYYCFADETNVGCMSVIVCGEANRIVECDSSMLCRMRMSFEMSDLDWSPSRHTGRIFALGRDAILDFSFWHWSLQRVSKGDKCVVMPLKLCDSMWHKWDFPPNDLLSISIVNNVVADI